MGAGKFDDATHDELYAMILNADPSQLNDVGTALAKAFSDINAIADELKAHVEHVKWDGDGGDAFRTWGHEVAKQTYKMADYTLSVGVLMGVAGQGLSEAKSAMPKPENINYIDPKKEKAKKDSAEPDRQEAIRQMEKLDSYYRTTYSDIDALEEPNFPPLPPGALSISGGEHQIPDGPSPSGAGATNFGNADHLALPSTGGLSNRGMDSTPSRDEAVSIKGAAVPDLAGTDIDSTVTTSSPDVVNESRATVSTHYVPPGQRTGVPGPDTLIGPRPLLPSVPPSIRVGESVRAPVGGYSEGTLTTPRGGIPRIGVNDGVVGGTPAPTSGQATAPRGSRGPVVGEERSPMGRAPTAASGNGFGSGNPGTRNSDTGRRRASEPGGVVDSPRVSNSVTGQRLPQGMVVGEENGVAGRGSMGSGPHTIATGVRTSGSSAPGRRLASEPGGIGGVQRVQSEGHSEFTPGGSGLVRGNQIPGVASQRSVASPKSSHRNTSGSGDHLAGGEVICPGGRRDTVPPVIE